MAQRRMLSKKIVDTDAFLSMSLSAQALYMHLVLNADDDGFVSNPRKIMRMIGCMEDDMKLLVGKKFVIGFDTGIVVIKHWKIHNLIRKDRYIETTYTREKQMLQTKPNKSYTLIGSNSTIKQNVIPNGNQMAPQYSIGKYSKVENSKDIVEGEFTPVEVIDYKSFMEYFNNLNKFSKVIKMTDKRKRHLKARLKDYSDQELMDLWKQASEIDFLTGKNDRGWKADFDWLVNENNLVKIAEGKYTNSKSNNGWTKEEDERLNERYKADI